MERFEDLFVQLCLLGYVSAAILKAPTMKRSGEFEIWMVVIEDANPDHRSCFFLLLFTFQTKSSVLSHM
jgi:hypothetical protein